MEVDTKNLHPVDRLKGCIEKLKALRDKIPDTEECRDLRERINKEINLALKIAEIPSVKRLRTYSTFGRGHSDRHC